MPDSRSPPSKDPGSGAPRAALDALLAGKAGGTLRRALWLDAVDQLLRPHLPRGLAAHARLANVRGDRLVYVVDSPAWHTRLRLAAPALIDAARSVGLEVTDLGVRTTAEPLHPPPLPAAGRRTPMSAAARSELATALALLRPDPPEDAGGDRKAGTRGARKTPAKPANGAS